jgi:hypothetical protein
VTDFAFLFLSQEEMLDNLSAISYFKNYSQPEQDGIESSHWAWLWLLLIAT